MNNNTIYRLSAVLVLVTAGVCDARSVGPAERQSAWGDVHKQIVSQKEPSSWGSSSQEFSCDQPSRATVSSQKEWKLPQKTRGNEPSLAGELSSAAGEIVTAVLKCVAQQTARGVVYIVKQAASAAFSGIKNTAQYMRDSRETGTDEEPALKMSCLRVPQASSSYSYSGFHHDLPAYGITGNPLCQAVEMGDADRAWELLIDDRVDPTEVDAYGRQAVHLAAAGNEHEILKNLLLFSTVSANARTSDGQTPLFLAVQNAAPQATECLVLKGADPHALVGGRSPAQIVKDNQFVPEVGGYAHKIVKGWVDAAVAVRAIEGQRAASRPEELCP